MLAKIYIRSLLLTGAIVGAETRHDELLPQVN
jgi:hypothetical protein